jgi:hypothetical protein
MKITKRKFKAVLCAILSVCVLTFSVYPVFAAEQESTETVTEETQATTIDPNDIDALESTRQLTRTHIEAILIIRLLHILLKPSLIK